MNGFGMREQISVYGEFASRDYALSHDWIKKGKTNQKKKAKKIKTKKQKTKKENK